MLVQKRANAWDVPAQYRFIVGLFGTGYYVNRFGYYAEEDSEDYTDMAEVDESI